MSSTDVRFRRATPSDAAVLSEFAERTFRDTFTASNSPSDMELYCAGAFGEEIQRRELADPMVTTLLGEANGELVAYAQLYDVEPDPSVRAEKPVELRRFYVAREHHGGHVARALMDKVINLGAGRGHDVMWLGVWERNPRAQRFYEKCGFEIVGDHIFLMGADPQRDLIMALALRS